MHYIRILVGCDNTKISMLENFTNSQFQKVNFRLLFMICKMGEQKFYLNQIFATLWENSSFLVFICFVFSRNFLLYISVYLLLLTISLPSTDPPTPRSLSYSIHNTPYDTTLPCQTTLRLCAIKLPTSFIRLGLIPSLYRVGEQFWSKPMKRFFYKIHAVCHKQCSLKYQLLHQYQCSTPLGT